MELVIAGLFLGLAGSFHCAGMCGPIAIILPLKGDNFIKKAYGGLLYNLGRTVTYGVMGAFFGLFGEGLELIGFQKWVSVIMGVIMIVSVFFPKLFQNQYTLNKSLFSFVGKLKNYFKSLLNVKTYSGLLLVGLVNGLIPCGLVYVALAGAIGTGSSVNGILFMVLFGLGTIPMMLTISLAGNMLSGFLRDKLNKLIPVLVVVVGLLFIVHGLGLGIPLLSPPEKKIKKKFKKELMKQDTTITHDSTNTIIMGDDDGGCGH